jgi:hypothetical protein
MCLRIGWIIQCVAHLRYIDAEFIRTFTLCYIILTTTEVFQSDTTQHNTTQHNTTQHNTTRHDTTRQYTTQHNTTGHNTTQHDTTRHDTTRHDNTRHNTTHHNTTQHFKVCRPSGAAYFVSTNCHQALINTNFRNVSTLAVHCQYTGSTLAVHCQYTVSTLAVRTVG